MEFLAGSWASWWVLELSLGFTSGNRSSTGILKVDQSNTEIHHILKNTSAEKAKNIAEEAREKKAVETSQNEQK